MSAGSTSEARDVFTLDAASLGASVVLMFKTAFIVSGAVALVLGVVLLLWPTRTVIAAAAVAGIYFIVSGVVRLVLGAFGSGVSTGHRVVNLLFGLLLVIGGIIALRNLAITAVSLLTLAVVVIGVGWIIDGVLGVVESRGAARPVWSILFGVLSIVAGISVVSVPAWAIAGLVIFVSVTLIVLGVVGIVRGAQFGRNAHPATRAATRAR